MPILAHALNLSGAFTLPETPLSLRIAPTEDEARSQLRMLPAFSPHAFSTDSRNSLSTGASHVNASVQEGL